MGSFFRRTRFGLLLLLLVGFGLRLIDLTRQNIWWDEARNIEVALRPFLQIATAPELDIQPPLYFWLLHLWGRLMGIEMGMDPVLVAFVARYFSVAMGLVGVALVFALTRRIGGLRAGIFALIIAVLAPLWLAESQEARMYTLSFALLTAAALAWAKGTMDWGSGARDRGEHPLRDRQLRRDQHRLPIHYSLFITFAALALATHYNAVFILVAWYVWWGILALLDRQRWRRLRTVIASGLAMTVLVLPLAPIALRQIPGYANPNLTVPTLAQYLSQNWVGFLGGYAWDAVMLGNWWLWAVLAVFVIGLAVEVRQRAKGQGDVASVQVASDDTPSAIRHSPFAPRLSLLAFLLTWLIGGLALYYIAVLDRGAFNIRYSSFVTPAFYALLGIALAAPGRLWRWLPPLGLALLLLGLVPALRADLTDSRFFREDTAGLAAWLHTQAAPGDVILVDQKYPFGFYYDRFAIDPSVTPTGDEAAPARYLFVDINTVDQRLTEWAGTAQRVFWVQWFESDTDPRGSVSFLLDKAGQRVGEQNFQGYWVQWWDLTPPTDFVLAETWTEQHLRWRNGPHIAAVSAPSTAVPGHRLPAVIRWQPGTEVVDRPLKARVALYNADGARLAQDDRRILNDRHLAPVEWTDADRPLNVYLLLLSADLPPGAYTLKVLVYDADTLEPLEVLDAAGNGAGIEVELGIVGVGG
ncbi:hypothetical protein GC175_13225 [bacterium]|nr:hypothetical protein [bacterium]